MLFLGINRSTSYTVRHLFSPVFSNFLILSVKYFFAIVVDSMAPHFYLVFYEWCGRYLMQTQWQWQRQFILCICRHRPIIPNFGVCVFYQFLRCRCLWTAFLLLFSTKRFLLLDNIFFVRAYKRLPRVENLLFFTNKFDVRI